jgi:hypothetical protein
MNGARAMAMMMTLAVASVLAAACTPDVGATTGGVPTAMQFDLTSLPPRVPQPTGLIVNQQTGKIDFSLAGTPLPADCSTQQFLPEAQCQFDKWLETLDGFPSVSTASAPASASLDPATLIANVVVVAAKSQTVVTNVEVGFDDATTSITVTPAQPWTLGELYWIGVRGYANGVRDTAGGEVVGSPTMALLKQETSLTCDATDAATLDPHCPGFEVVAQGAASPEAAAMQVFQLEQIRQGYVAGGAFESMAAAGLPREEIAVLWGFPIHTNSVPLLIPPTAAVPHVPAANQIAVGVQGAVDPATVSAFVVRQQNGPVVVMDLAAANAGDLNAAFPPVGAAYVVPPGAPAGVIAIQALAPFPAGHPIGLFFSNGIHSPDGAPLVASPVSILLSLSAPLVDSSGHSTVSILGDADAAALESGRAQLAPLFDNPLFAPLTGVSRANLVYAYAFIPMVQP